MSLPAGGAAVGKGVASPHAVVDEASMAAPATYGWRGSYCGSLPQRSARRLTQRLVWSAPAAVAVTTTSKTTTNLMYMVTPMGMWVTMFMSRHGGRKRPMPKCIVYDKSEYKGIT
ncbi:hypothetical protein E2562_014554 [Oryza meyeriana var. granulata]|uniref:Uncharacterized protein n=1 Tax=Oryza meyeriana var. granulata TaxID=110450 RepID=A0A6G1ELA3_9ORYZ|nr:hypothetical protein E2562_014554 [Oryza meyeriana var. granulata]